MFKKTWTRDGLVYVVKSGRSTIKSLNAILYRSNFVILAALAVHIFSVSAIIFGYNWRYIAITLQLFPIGTLNYDHSCANNVGGS